MLLECPSLGLHEEASLKSLSTAVVGLEGKENPFLILSVNPMTYMQALWTEDGYVLECQDGSVAEHYVAEKLLSTDAVNSVLSE
jgi:hypothetical protein